MGGVSRHFSEISGSGADVTLLKCPLSAHCGKKRGLEDNEDVQGINNLEIGLEEAYHLSRNYYGINSFSISEM